MHVGKDFKDLGNGSDAIDLGGAWGAPLAVMGDDLLVGTTKAIALIPLSTGRRASGVDKALSDPSTNRLGICNNERHPKTSIWELKHTLLVTQE